MSGSFVERVCWGWCLQSAPRRRCRSSGSRAGSSRGSRGTGSIPGIASAAMERPLVGVSTRAAARAGLTARARRPASSAVLRVVWTYGHAEPQGFGQVHVPLSQSSFAAHTWPQPPQFCGSYVSFTHPPSHIVGQPAPVEELPQSVGPLHCIGPHWPVASQVWFRLPVIGELGGGQNYPHGPRDLDEPGSQPSWATAHPPPMPELVELVVLAPTRAAAALARGGGRVGRARRARASDAGLARAARARRARNATAASGRQCERSAERRSDTKSAGFDHGSRPPQGPCHGPSSRNRGPRARGSAGRVPRWAMRAANVSAPGAGKLRAGTFAPSCDRGPARR